MRKTKLTSVAIIKIPSFDFCQFDGDHKTKEAFVQKKVQ